MQAKDFLSTQPSHYMYVNGACAYMLCFHRTDCLQHLPLQVHEWCMCLHALLSVQDRLSKSPSHSQFKQEITSSSTWCVSGTSSKSQVILFLPPLICLWGIKISWYWSMYPFVLTLDQDAEKKWQLPFRVLCECLPPLQVPKVTSCPWVQFMLAQSSGYCFWWCSLSPLQVWMGGAGVKRVDYTDGISTESPVCDGALQLHQVISPCERCCWLSCIPTTPGHLVYKMGPREKMHGNTVQLFRSSFHSPAREDSHYMQVIAACDLHAFLPVQQMLTSLYRVQESDVFHYVVQVTTRKSQDIRARNTFHHVVQVTTRKSQDIRARNTFHYVEQATTCKSQEFIDIQTRHLSKQTKINMCCKFCFYAF